MADINLTKIGWQNGTLVSKAKVEIGGTIYEVEPEEYSGATPLSAENLIQMEENTEDAINNVFHILEGTILYNDNTGTTGNVTLLDNSENYNIIEIFYTTGNRSGSVKVQDFKNNQRISLNLTGMSASTFVNVVKEINISGTSIIKLLERTFLVSGGGSIFTFNESNDVLIKKVIGYNY